MPDGRGSLLVPALGILRETGTLQTYDAEMLAGRRLHHYPALQSADYHGTQLLKACHFSGHVVGLDIDVNATLVVHPLDLHDRLVGRGHEHSVISAAVRMVSVNYTAERLAPKARGLVNV